MDLGAFSLSLAVKDLEVSNAFYEKPGFTVFGGGRDSELVNHEKRGAYNWAVSGDV